MFLFINHTMEMSVSSPLRSGKILALLVLLSGVFVPLTAQTGDPLETYYENLMERNRYGMMVLGSWAAVNMATGAVGYYRGEGVNRYFHQMNLFWNVVNMGIASTALFSSMPETLSMGEVLQTQIGFEKAFMVNGALDVAYMAGGLYLIERSKNVTNRATRLRGYGRSVILQGAFLFAFDFTMYFIQHHHYKMDLLPMINQMGLPGGGLTLHLTF